MKSKIYKEQILVDFLQKSAGVGSEKVAAVLWESKRPLKDEKIAEKTGLKVTEVRTILNRLHYRGIVNYEKDRDEKSGWYNYTWYIDKKKLVELIINELCEVAEKLEKERALKENYTLFICKKGCCEVPFEIAAEYNFKCPECGLDMDCLNPRKMQTEINKRISAIRKQIDGLSKIK
ncbi:MAG: hypothetical protein QXM75_00190 [Candidatus Diapherotrites archaeon]